MNIQASNRFRTLANTRFSPETTPESGASSTQALDSVQLSSFNSTHFEAAAHLERANQEYMSLIHTHPTEAKEFSHGAQRLKTILADILYGGEWPQSEEIPKLPKQATPGKPQDNGGLTRSEQLVSNDLVSLYRKANKQATQTQHEELVTSMHLCQSSLQSRILRRYHPNYWMSSPGTLMADSQREQVRWGRSF